MSGRDIIPHGPPFAPDAEDPRIVERNRARVERGFWSKLKSNVGRIPFLEDAVGAYYCAFDPDTPRSVKATLLAALAYFVVPTDIVPDFIAALGFTDDATVLFATLRMVAGNITDDHRAQARKRLAQLDLLPGGMPEARPGEGEGA
jgi:uncharacterized membrane protein YkvA (DUF1232 family)